MAAKIYYEKDAPIAPLKGKKVATIGYGKPGPARTQFESAGQRHRGRGCGIARDAEL